MLLNILNLPFSAKLKIKFLEAIKLRLERLVPLLPWQDFDERRAITEKQHFELSYPLSADALFLFKIMRGLTLGILCQINHHKQLAVSFHTRVPFFLSTEQLLLSRCNLTMVNFGNCQLVSRLFFRCPDLHPRLFVMSFRDHACRTRAPTFIQC